ncbi:DUF4962 domain-containing protein [Candidatus Parcubacteria bacterium]|nr:DUF4962 domain-containing protein [Patescibacteria group bacterium]MBU4380631.1 DUF4962 domain-containing protein [Patescibacteria group bacterium]MCG2689548.1 DUF4962 domain-containing protein [Candidatus Parcubacteria bacterium]
MFLKKLSDYHLFLLAFFVVIAFIFVFSPRQPTRKIPQEVEIALITGEVSRPETLMPLSDTIIEETKPHFEWNPAPNFLAQKYLFQLSSVPTFLKDLVEGDPRAADFKVPKSLDSGVYFWRVRAINSNGDKSLWSFKSCFVLGPMEQKFPSPELTSPVYERIKFVPGQKIAINFKWEPSYYSPYCFVFPQKYLVEIGQDAYFKTVLYNREVATNKLPLEDTAILLNAMPQGVASTPFFWKVKPVDNWGQEGEWSKTENFYLVDSTVSKL